jgi:hypothetical protein
MNPVAFIPVKITNPKYPDEILESRISVRGIYNKKTKSYDYSVSEEFIADLFKNSTTNFCVIDKSRDINFD